uniref:Uncharacterized protein n=1 Tax=Arundo donax TaxID=35708 RepID=A0A0A8YH08_ARUDO
MQPQDERTVVRDGSSSTLKKAIRKKEAPVRCAENAVQSDNSRSLPFVQPCVFAA